MDKKIFGIKLGTILSVFLCLIAAIIFWLAAKYSERDAAAAIANLLTLR